MVLGCPWKLHMQFLLEVLIVLRGRMGMCRSYARTAFKSFGSVAVTTGTLAAIRSMLIDTAVGKVLSSLNSWLLGVV